MLLLQEPNVIEYCLAVRPVGGVKTDRRGDANACGDFSCGMIV